MDVTAPFNTAGVELHAGLDGAYVDAHGGKP